MANCQMRASRAAPYSMDGGSLRDRAQALILGIDTSCDDTAAAVVAGGRRELSSVVSSQIADHAVFGGIVPEIASRRHVEAIIPVIAEALSRAGVGLGDIDAVAATYGPGLVGALLVGLSSAKGLAYALGKPFIGVCHIEAHICANYIAHPDLEPPFTALVVSGGHTSIYLAEAHGRYRLQGRTRDDAAGEALDKVARACGLGFPGGAKLDEAAEGGDPHAIKFPVARFSDGSIDFSFSGVKTAAVNALERERRRLASASGGNATGGAGAAGGNAACAGASGGNIAYAGATGSGAVGSNAVYAGATGAGAASGNATGGSSAMGAGLSPAYMRGFYASFRRAVVEPLVANTMRAEAANKTGKIALAGGVAANRLLRAWLADEAREAGGIEIFAPPPRLCTDNAAMVASAAYGPFMAGVFSPLGLNAEPSASLHAIGRAE